MKKKFQIGKIINKNELSKNEENNKKFKKNININKGLYSTKKSIKVNLKKKWNYLFSKKNKYKSK